MTDVAILRQALIESLPSVDHAGAEPDREPAFTYVPPSHAKALDPDVSLVEGIRGAGKSFWWAQLASERHRDAIVKAFPEIRVGSGVKVVKAFGAQASSVDAPSQDVLASLAANYPPRAIWKAVLAQKAGLGEGFPSTEDWPQRVAWVVQQPEAFDRALEEFRHWYNYEHYHKGIGNLHPADVYFGRSEAILKQRQLLKEQTKKARKQANLNPQQNPRRTRNLRTKSLH